MDIQLRNFLVWIYLYTISICLPQCTWADNISQGKPASQLGKWSGYGAERAVDGNTDQNLDHGSCAHPDGLDGALDSSVRGDATWWSVDLSAGDVSKRFIIENVTIYFRSCCESRIIDVEILVGNNSDVGSHQECASVSSSDYLQTLPCSPTTPASYLTIRHPSNPSLGLCEVIVNGYQYQACQNGKWGQGCLLDCNCGNNNCNDITGECAVSVCSPGSFGQNCNGRCNCFDQSEVCDPADGYCRSGCNAGYMNTGCSTLCREGTFGRGCAFDCHCSNIQETCNPVSGGCPQSGCEEDYWGSNCSIPLPTINARPRRISETETSVTMEFPASTPRAEEYLVEYAVDDGGFVNYTRGVTVPDTNKDRYTVTQRQLTPATHYRLRVVPFVSSRRGGESDPLFISTSTPQIPEITDAPRKSASTPPTATSITVEFQPSHPVAETYRVEYRPQGTTIFFTGVEVEHVPGQTQVAKLEGLQSATEYDIQIIPVNQNGQGRPSPVAYIRTEACPAGFFGKTCNAVCNCREQSVACDPRDGYCRDGCSQGYTGTNCSIPTTPVTINNIPPTTTTTTVATTSADDGGGTAERTDGGSNGGMIAGILVVIIIVIIIVVAFLLYRRKKSGKPLPGSSRIGSCFARLNPVKLGSEVDPGDKPSPPTTTTQISPPVYNVEDPPEVRVMDREETSVPSTPMPTPDPERKEVVVAPPPIRLEDLSTYIKNKKNQTDAFKDEFKKLPIGPTSKWEVGNKPENRNKNRFLNIRAYDHSRVVLDVLPEDLHSDYINADYISGYEGIEKVYVAAQGPKKGTLDDTWRLVWQTESNRIVMVTNLVEGGRIKCEQYWPNKGTEEYGDVKVTLVSTDNYAAYLIRIFNVERAGESRTIRQFHFTSWPDHGVPTVATELLEFRRRVKSFDKEATGPLVIHCSAGVGRTGTYIAVDYCLQQAEQEHEVNIWGITNQMRKQRVNMIQTLDQYIFVHDAIQEALLSGETIITASNFRTEYGRLCREDPDTNKTLLSKQFETLETLKTPPGDTKPLVALETENIKKNRSKEIVPSNRYRPFLSSIVEGTTSYINAVYVDGFREKLAYLVTQMPLPNTVVDLWRLMHDHHSSTIVMLNALDKNDKEVGVYWPEDTEHSLNYGALEVMMTSVDTEHPHITIRDFKIMSTKTRRTPVVRQFQLNTWPKEDTYPESRRSLLELMDMIEKWQQQTGNGPVTIHDMNGATRCGLFVATLYATEQLKVDQAVDVFGAVKQVRIPRPHFIEDIDQYKFVHEMVLEYMSGFGDYSNFS